MNRLELAAQAPPVPFWYYKSQINKNEVFIKEEANKNIEYKKIKYKYELSEIGTCERRRYKELMDSFLKSFIDNFIDFDWRFYWADEMIKRNEK